MAGNAYLIANVVLRADGREYHLGTGDLPVTVALTAGGAVDAGQFDVANGATATLWDAAVSPAGSFKFLGLLSDKTVMLEFQGTTVADNHHETLFANVPLYLASDDTLAYNALSFTGGAQDFKKVLAKNSSGSAAVIQVLIGE